MLGTYLTLFALACGAAQPTQVGRLTHPELTESSGLVASRQFADVFWTHNDGNKPFLYAIKRDGQALAAFRIEGASFEDWEDIALGSGNELFLADSGNNKRKRRDLTVYAVDEPAPTATAKVVPVKRRWVLRYPNEPFDSEGLFVWDGSGYLISKVTDDQKAAIFRFALAENMRTQTLEPVTRVDVTSPVTGADLSADGRFLGLTARSGVFVFKIDGDVARAGQEKPVRTKFRHDSIEGCCFVPGGVLACAESREVYFFSEEVLGLRLR